MATVMPFGAALKIFYNNDKMQYIKLNLVALCKN